MAALVKILSMEVSTARELSRACSRINCTYKFWITCNEALGRGPPYLAREQSPGKEPGHRSYEQCQDKARNPAYCETEDTSQDQPDQGTDADKHYVNHLDAFWGQPPEEDYMNCQQDY